jgi:hypothetical protein
LIWSTVQRWRAKTDDQSFEGLVKLDKRCRAPVYSRVFPTWPEWPSHPFLFVPAAECERRFAILYPGKEEALRALALSPDPALLLDGEEGFRNLLRQLQKSWQKDRALHVYPTEFESHEFLRIPWWKADTDIIEWFGAWLRVNSPPGRRIYTGGLRTIEQRWRADLKALGALRLLRAMRGDWSLCPQLYAEPGEWTKARERAETIVGQLTSLSPPAPSLGIHVAKVIRAKEKISEPETRCSSCRRSFPPASNWDLLSLSFRRPRSLWLSLPFARTGAA